NVTCFGCGEKGHYKDKCPKARNQQNDRARARAYVVADALSRKERLKPRRVRAMSITIHSGLKTKILEAQSEASKDIKAPAEWLRGLERHFEQSYLDSISWWCKEIDHG
ncbi:putative reverse transcriptase domain-containing protein, partial [Tanacetum coccineum]